MVYSRVGVGGTLGPIKMCDMRRREHLFMCAFKIQLFEMKLLIIIIEAQFELSNITIRGILEKREGSGVGWGVDG